MKTFTIPTKEGVVTLNLPTNFKEITPKYLTDVTSHIEVGQHYALVALCYRQLLAEILNKKNQRETINAAVVPVFVKANDPTRLFDQYVAGIPLVIAGSDLALGYHVTAPMNKISIPNIIDLASADTTRANDDKFAYYALRWREYAYFVEFKIVPLNVIHGAIGEVDETIDNPFYSIVK